MTRTNVWMLALAACFTATASHADTAVTAATAAAPAGASMPATPTLEQLRFMAGSWHGEDGAVQVEELWMEPRGGLMLGLHRDVSARGAFFEFLRIEEREDGITYWASPGGRTPTPFRLVATEARKAVFENLEHDFPQRITYWLGAEDKKLHARVEGTVRGELRSQEWAWERSTRSSTMSARDRLERSRKKP